MKHSCNAKQRELAERDRAMTTNRSDGRRRVIIEGITPQVDCGRFPAKRTVGDQVRVEADIFTDGHDAIAASLLAHREGSDEWTEIPMKPLVNDRWEAAFRVSELGRYGYKVQGWVDHFETWRRDLLKRIKAESDAAVDYLIGADLVVAGRRQSHWRRCRVVARTGGRFCVLAKAPSELQDPCDRPDAARAGAALSRQAVCNGVESGVDDRCRSGAGAIQFMVRILSRAPQRRKRERTAHLPIARNGCPTSRRWASTLSTCRRFIRSGECFAKGRNNNPESQARRFRQPLGNRRQRRRTQGNPERPGNGRRFQALCR